MRGGNSARAAHDMLLGDFDVGAVNRLERHKKQLLLSGRHTFVCSFTAELENSRMYVSGAHLTVA